MEVEQFVGVPRTKIRHYMDKGLLNVAKDDQSGYYFYSFEDLMKLCQIVYYREQLGFSIEKVEQLLETTDIHLIESITKKQLETLSAEVQLIEKQRNTLIFNQTMLERQQRYENKLTVIPFEAAYIVPYAYYFIPNHKVYPIIYGASEFSFRGAEVSHVRRCSLAFEKDAAFVGEEAFNKFRIEGERVEGGGMCIYTVIKTQKNVHDPSLLQPAIDWADEHHFCIKGRIFATHFFPYYSEEMSCAYVEVYLPIDLPS